MSADLREPFPPVVSIGEAGPLARAPDVVCLLDCDARIVVADGACEALWGRDAAELRGTPFATLVGGVDSGDPADALRRAQVGECARLVLPGAHRDPRLATELTLVPYGPTGRVAGILVAARILDAEGGEEGVAELVPPAPTEPFFFYVRDRSGRLEQLSPAVQEVTGFAAEELIGEPLSRLAAEELPAAAFEGGAINRTVRFRHRDGRLLWVELLESPMYHAGQAAWVQGVAREITAERERHQRLRHDALHDPLTHLPNRALFFDRLEHTAQAAARDPDSLFAVLMVDLDDFKVINDRLGHHAGDRVLQEVAARLQRCVRPGDTVCRLGGDEFAILLAPIRDATDATRVSERIRAELSASFRLPPDELFVTCSVGVALSATGYDDPRGLLRDADTALYRAKAKGKGRHEVFDGALRESTLVRLQLENDLRNAVRRGELRMHYQPVVSLRTGRVEGMEALLRWQHPTRGLLAPRDFLPVAEQTGMVGELDHWALREACRQLHRWRERRGTAPSRVSVNLSDHSLRSPGLLEHLRRVFAEMRMDPSSLAVEVGVSAFAGPNPSAEAEATLLSLAACGVVIDVDRVGTSSLPLAALGRLPVHALKVDGALLREPPSQGEVVRGLVELAHALGASVVAGGVETEEETDRVRRAGCDFAQGFRFGAPVDQEGVRRLLDGSQS